MVKIREVLRLQAEGHPQRKIAATVNCLCSTVQKLSNSACFMSGVRTKTIIGRDRLRIRKPPNYGAPGEIIRAARSPLRGRPSGVQRRSGAVLRGLRPLVVRFAADRRRATRVDVQLGRGRPSCRTLLVFCREFELSREMVETGRWSSSREIMVRPERLLAADAARPPLRSGPPPRYARRRPTWQRTAKLSNSACFLSGVRIIARNGRDREMVLEPRNNGAPGEIRTPDLLVRSQALYPTELRARANAKNAL